MTAEETLGLLYVAAILAGFLYILWQDFIAIWNNHDGARDALLRRIRSEPLSLVLAVYVLGSVVVFLGVIVFGNLIFKDGSSALFLWIPGSWVAIFFVNWLVNTRGSSRK